MKKLSVFTALLLALSLSCSGALAATANASIVAPATYKLTAPFAGTLLPFDLMQGDTVEEGEILFALDTTPVYAAQSGTVAAVFVSAFTEGLSMISKKSSALNTPDGSIITRSASPASSISRL